VTAGHRGGADSIEQCHPIEGTPQAATQAEIRHATTATLRLGPQFGSCPGLGQLTNTPSVRHMLKSIFPFHILDSDMDETEEPACCKPARMEETNPQ
jgi:hypothetical protein